MHRPEQLLELALMALCSVVAGCSQQAPPSRNGFPGPQGDNLQSISQLPDWSGIWVLGMDGGAKEASEDSFATDNGRVPLTPKYMELRAAARAAKAQNSLSSCLPAGTPGTLQHGFLHEYLFTPGRVTVLVDDGEQRRIYTDGRAHRSLDELNESYMGDSTGHWEGQALVVDTIGFPNGSLFQNHGLKATRNSHLVERIFLKDKSHLEIDSSLTDPEIFTKPYAYTRVYEHSALPLDEPGCLQYNRDNGETIDLTPPPEH